MTNERDHTLPTQDQPQPDPIQDQPGPAAIQDQPRLSLAQELAELVRDRTKAEAKLTPLDRVETEGELLSRERQEELVAEMQSDDACHDIQVLRTAAGGIHVYSKLHMTDSYARILLRVEDGNPYEQIAVPVREHSKIYPRTTSLEELKDSAYGIDPERLRPVIDEMIQMEQYGDIKLVTASTGALYLYSELHLSKSHAEFLVEWEEVGKYKNL